MNGARPNPGDAAPVTVAIDARKLRDGGIGTYIRGLLGALAAAPGRARYVALVDPAQVGSAAWAGPVHEVPVAAARYGFSEHWVVPHAARAAGAALLHAPHYTLPLGWSGPSVVTIHDLIHVRFARFFPPGVSLYARALAGLAARRARAVIANSEHTRRDIVELLGVPESKVTVIPLGIAPGLQPPQPGRLEAFRARRGLPPGYLLYVGARKRHKNLALLLDALGRIDPAARPPLVLSGPRWQPGSALGAQAARLGLDPIVHFAGEFRDDEELACLYAGAALYAQPSLTEGFGLPPLEAMACGTPVLCSTGGALPETVGEAAVLLPPMDAERWAAAIVSLLGDAARREVLRRRGLERAAGFSWAAAAVRTRAVYATAIGRAV